MMSKDALAKTITIALMAGGLVFFAARKMTIGKPAAESTPQDAIYGMLDAARAGDVKGYLSRYTGQMESSLKQSLSERPEAAFRDYLRSSNKEIKGVAVGEPKALSDREVEVRVEYVYQDRNEVQLLYLEKLSSGWKIARIADAQRVKTLVPYGTPVQ
jgi:hypothetical protein